MESFMPKKYIKLEKLARKGFHVSIPVVDQVTWRRFVTQDPSIPQTFARLRDYKLLLLDPNRRKTPRTVRVFPSIGSIRSLYEECGEAAWQRLFRGLSNPALTSSQRAIIEADIDADLPTFDHNTETTHFILRWTDSSANSADNITDSSIITETGNFLETAWGMYNTAFARAPYVPAGGTKIEVVFYDIGGYYGVASPPDGPIQLSSNSWVATPAIRRPVSAHELFHKLQYAFGFRTSWDPPAKYKYYSEGLCSWAEVFVWQCLSGKSKLTDMFTNPNLNLYDASYNALPFWVFFDARQKSSPTDNPILHYLTTCEPTGDLKAALDQVIGEEWPPNNVYSKLGNFYALFARGRRIGDWRTGPVGTLYPNILAPDGTAIAPALLVTNVPIGLSDTYSVSDLVSQLGSRYYRFAFEPDANGKTFSFSVNGTSGGDFAFYLIWEKGNAWKRATFPPNGLTNYSYSETVNLTEADTLVLSISGHDSSGTYNLSASIT